MPPAMVDPAQTQQGQQQQSHGQNSAERICAFDLAHGLGFSGTVPCLGSMTCGHGGHGASLRSEHSWSEAKAVLHLEREA
mmetsp:Transcript_75837/g.146596  ORF Transcript_75837/g.146596 Transcript_75837/m.146596 type:complete len:80 (+) Transcript_75837:1962-2201(+)